ncbi:hypothetical protein EDC04DRAFT_2681984 [Pisolithus marmoratus]|nr:hypothetical protein EDC04DRAFT_2681984 [Pisolithus marmoratus]
MSVPGCPNNTVSHKHLPPSDSLPILCLCPNRPLFVCRRCGFSNTWIPLCLWCKWTSAEATKEFENNTPRSRRLSTPAKILSSRVDRPRPPRSSSVGSIRCSMELLTPPTDVPFSTRNGNTISNSAAVVSESWKRHRDSTSRRGPRFELEDEDAGSDINAVFASAQTAKTKTEAVDNEPDIVTATHLSNEGSDVEDRRENGLLRGSARHRRKPCALRLSTVRTHSPNRSDPKLSCRRRGSPFTFQDMCSMTSVLSDASNSTRGTDCMVVPSGSPMESTPSVQSSRCSPTRVLRRKRPMMLRRRESSDSLHPHSRPSSPSPLCECNDMSLSSATEILRSGAITPPLESDPPVRLGHPNRPYYSAIRKNMSRPNSPVVPRTPSPIPSHYEYTPRGTKSLDCGERPYGSLRYAHSPRPMSMVLPVQMHPERPYSGFSLSGETEMRMELARWRREDAPDQPGDFLFHERSRSRIRGKVKGTVERLGKGLKHLVLGRS